MLWSPASLSIMAQWARTGNTPSTKRFANGGNMPTVDNQESRRLQSAPGEQAPWQHLSDLTDQEFCDAFESLRIPKEVFHHREHIRLAWIYLTHYAEEEAIARMVQGIRAFAKHHGVEGKYHHTITLAWMQLVLHAIRNSPRAPHFCCFAHANPHLLHQRLLSDYYSSEALRQNAARAGWIEPDLRPLP
jgi:hypothetical protein